MSLLGKSPMSDLILCSSVILKGKSTSKHGERPEHNNLGYMWQRRLNVQTFQNGDKL